MFDRYYLKNAFKKNIAFSARVQCVFQWFGIAIHNPYRDECCIDFECCNPKKNSNHWLHISEKQLPIRRKVWYKETAPIGTKNRTFIRKTKWVIKLKEK